MSGRFWIISFLTVVAVVLMGVKWILPLLSSKKTVSEGREMRVGSATVWVMVADDPDEMEKGLGDRDVLAENEGMVFVYPQPVTPRFWMKGMRFALDFVWIREGKVVDLLEGVQPPTDNEKNLELFSPKEPVTHVLEVNEGWVQRNGIKVGDLVTLN